MNAKNGRDIPLGLGMALMQNADAFFYFSGLDAEKQQKNRRLARHKVAGRDAQLCKRHQLAGLNRPLCGDEKLMSA